MSIKLKRTIALLAALCLAFSCLPMNSGTVKTEAAEDKILYVDRMDTYHAKLYYMHAYNGTVDPSDWDSVINATDNYRDSLDEAGQNELSENETNFVFDNIEVVNCSLNEFFETKTKKVTCATSGAIDVCLRYDRDDNGKELNKNVCTQKLTITDTGSVIDGHLIIRGNVSKFGEDFGPNNLNAFIIESGAEVTISDTGYFIIEGNGRLELKKNATISFNGSTDMSGANNGWIRANEGSRILVNGSAVSVPIDGKNIEFNGLQSGDYLVKFDNGSWSGQEAPSMKDGEEIVLPRDIDSFNYTYDNWDYDAAYGYAPVFKTVTIDKDYELRHEIYTDEFVIPAGVTVTVKNNTSGKYDYAPIIRVYEHTDIAGTLILTESPETTLLRDGDSFIDINDRLTDDINEAITDVHTLEMSGVADISGTVKAEGNAHIALLNIITLNVTGNGQIITDGGDIGERLGSFLWTGSEPYGAEEKVEINVASEKSISSKQVLNLKPETIVRVGGQFYTIDEVNSGDYWDTSSHKNFKLDGKNNDSSWIDIDFTNGSWTVLNKDELWWGAPFENEYRVYFTEGGVKADGKEITTNDFITFTKGKAIEFELTPPSGFTGSPIVIINGGYYAEDGENTVYRSDDFKASDMWYSKIKKIEVKDNKFTWTPDSDDPLRIEVFWTYDNILLNATRAVDSLYEWSGATDAEGNWNWHVWSEHFPYDLDNEGNIETERPYDIKNAWAPAGNEFMVEVTTNGNGNVTISEAFEAYRLGNTVKGFYQGFELLGGNTVDVILTPSSGYELSYITVDGTSYSPSALSGLTESNGVYTYKITKTPANSSTIVGDKLYRTSVKETKIQATFTAIYTPSGSDSSSTTVTTTPTPEVTQAPATPTPEVTVEKEDDGSTTTTKVTENTDGSKTIETETKAADGSVTTSTTIENKDGSSVTESETKNADGTKTTEKTVEKADGSSTTVSKTVDENGKVLSTTEEEVSKNSKGTEIVETKTENADGSSVESVVKTTTAGKVVAETVETDPSGNVSITLETDKTDGSEVVKTFESEKDDNIKLTDYDTKGSTAVVPGEIKVGDSTYTVTTIGKKALAGNTSIKKVKLPETITTIGKGAFQGASNLKKIELGSEITKVSKNAFAGIAKNAQIRITATKEEFERIVALIKASGVDSSIQFKRVKP